MAKSKIHRSWNDHYICIKEMGSGGNAHVYLVQSNETNCQYALKELYNLSKEKKARFLSEIEIAKGNAGVIKGIIPIISSNEEEFWYIMPVANPILEKNEKLSVKQIVEGTIQLCETLEQLHAKAIFHRDIKPDNIYIYEGRFALGDFGLVDFPENTEELTQSDRGLGATFTIAPEMKRTPKEADGGKADVYSLAKTLWMFLSDNNKGFEGVYTILDSKHSLRRCQKCSKIHLVEIEELLIDATSNDPMQRPNITQFKERLKHWIDIYEDEEASQESDWYFLRKLLFGAGANIPDSAKWTSASQIVEVLNIIGHAPAFNHMYFSDGGGLDFAYAEIAHESGCIYIYDTSSGCLLLKPKSLEYEGFDKNIRWNYFILDFDHLEPIISEPCVKSCERLVEDSPAHYVDASDAIYGVYDYDNGIPLPKESRIVYRYTHGRLLFVMKFGPYNRLSVTYDGRHGKFRTCADFRAYVDSLVEIYNSYYSAINEKARQLGSSLEEIDDYILEQAEFQFDPFLTLEEKYQENVEEHVQINDIINEEKYVEENILTWNFSSILIADQSKDSYAHFYFVLHQARSRNIANFDRSELYLCKDGSVQRLLAPDDEKCYYVAAREDAVNIQRIVQSEVAKRISEAGIRLTGGFRNWVSITMKKAKNPVHLFTKDEIESLMRTADDRTNNQLVIDEKGYAQIITEPELGMLYAVRQETWCAGNNYVGKYSPLYTVENDYLFMLLGWLRYLKSGRSQYVDFIDPDISEEYILSEIKKEFNITQ